MDFTTSCISVHVAIQKLFRLPVTYQRELSDHPIMQLRPDWNKRNSWGIPSAAKIHWTFSKWFIIICGALSLLRMAWQLRYWEQVHNFEMIGFDSLAVTLGIIAAAAYNTIDCHMNLICYYITQRFSSVSYSNRALTDRFPKKIVFRDIFIFQFSIGFFVTVPVFYLLPFFRDYDLVQTFLTQLARFLFHEPYSNKSNLPFSVIVVVKLIPSLVYAVTLNHAVSVLLLVLITLNIMVLEAYIEISERVLRLSYSTRGSLYNCMYRLSIFRVLNAMGYIVNNRIFAAVLTGMGTLVASLCGFVTILMYSQFPLIMYLSCATMFVSSIVTTLVLITLAAIPNSNIEKFRQNWKIRVRRKQEKVLLMSCPEIGFGIGFLRIIKYGTAFTIIDNIINFTMSLVLF